LVSLLAIAENPGFPDLVSVVSLICTNVRDAIRVVDKLGFTLLRTPFLDVRVAGISLSGLTRLTA
jgi:hypothetical protein